jgi:hypothetical protein
VSIQELDSLCSPGGKISRGQFGQRDARGGTAASESGGRTVGAEGANRVVNRRGTEVGLIEHRSG